jgi:hypothetical protein
VQVWWTNNTQSIRLLDITGLAKVIPYLLLHPLRARDDTGILVAFGGVVFSGDGSVLGVTDWIKFVWSDAAESSDLISPLHFSSPGTIRVGGSLESIRAAFTTLIVSCARARHSQIDRQQRRATVGGSLGDSFLVAAALEQHHGELVTVERDKLVIHFSDTSEVEKVLGQDVSFCGAYGLGTSFTLQPPFGILYQPHSGRCWVRCAPEEVHLPSGLNYSGPNDQFPEGYEDMPVEPGC